eukprot:311622-Alexandrium_andersonii.AAC.1
MDLQRRVGALGERCKNIASAAAGDAQRKVLRWSWHDARKLRASVATFVRRKERVARLPPPSP